MLPESSSKNGNGGGMIFKVLQISVPVLIFVLGVYIHQVDNNITAVKSDAKTNYELVFKHLTNDEIHTPKSISLTRPEFAIYQQFRDKQMTDLANIQIQQSRDMKDGFDKLYKLVERHIEQTSKFTDNHTYNE
jgi:hypothetical protein